MYSVHIIEYFALCKNNYSYYIKGLNIFELSKVVVNFKAYYQNLVTVGADEVFDLIPLFQNSNH